MYPYIHLFGRDFPSYMLMATIGFAAVLLTVWLNTRKRSDVDQTQLLHIALAAMGGLVIGAHLLYGIVNLRVIFAAAGDGFSLIHSFWEMGALIASVFGGMVFYGGLFGAIAGTLWYTKVMQMPQQPYMDILAFSVPLFHGFARIGCFLGGCCYGIESACGFVYHEAISASANGVRRFPVQLLESGCEFVLFAVLLVIFQQNRLKNRLLYVYLAAYSVIRFFDEFLRGDALRGFVGILSTSQFISVLVLTGSTILLIRKRRYSLQQTHPEGEI